MRFDAADMKALHREIRLCLSPLEDKLAQGQRRACLNSLRNQELESEPRTRRNSLRSKVAQSKRRTCFHPWRNQLSGRRRRIPARFSFQGPRRRVVLRKVSLRRQLCRMVSWICHFQCPSTTPVERAGGNQVRQCRTDTWQQHSTLS